MNQPWSFPEYGNVATEIQGEEDPTLVAQTNPSDEANQAIWYPESSWDITNPSTSFHHPSLQDQMPAIPPDFDNPQGPLSGQPLSSGTSSEYDGSLYTPTTRAASGSQSSSHQFQYTGDMEIDVGRLSGDNSTSGQGSGPLLDPRRHHHYIRGRSADQIQQESASSAERRRAQNRNSQRSFRRRKEERLQELETRVTELETQVQSLEDRGSGLEARNRELEERNRVLEERTREVEGWNRELVDRVEGLRGEVEVLRGGVGRGRGR